MPIKVSQILTVLVFSSGLLSCSEQAEDTLAEIQSEQAQEAPINFNTQITIREIMASLIDPHADALWNSVRIISDANGITEYFPETDEEWTALRSNAVTIIEGSNALMMPGRLVAPPGATGIFPEFEFTPEEVAERLVADFQSWEGFARGLQDAAIEMLDAVDAQDPDKLSDSGAFLDEACEACHSVYWYRAGI
ncbi:MAG: hypothetical protein P8M72_06245 [Gammaproteobacteria bacterium]|nr:hypothetical protein [Gammaproteobacteria bacterium]